MILKHTMRFYQCCSVRMVILLSTKQYEHSYWTTQVNCHDSFYNRNYSAFWSYPYMSFVENKTYIYSFSYSVNSVFLLFCKYIYIYSFNSSGNFLWFNTNYSLYWNYNCRNYFNNIMSCSATMFENENH